MPPDPPRGSTLRVSLLPLRGKAFSHSTPTKKLGIYEFPVISNKEKFVLALVINIIFPVIYFYDDNPLFSTLKNTSVFCFHGAKCSQAKEETAYESMQ